MMRELDQLQRHGRRRTKIVAAAVALFVVGSGFAAAGGVEAVKSWWTHIEVIDSNRVRATDARGSEIGELILHGGGPEGAEDNAPISE